MIIKSRGLPIRILKGEALQNRLPKNHEKQADIERDLKIRWKGYSGEQSLDYFLQFLPRGKYLIFHDLRLKGERNFFQMDTLILSPFFALIIEVKNYSGTLIFDTELNQFTRINHQNKEEGFQDPIAQARRQHLQLFSWLQERHFPQIPLEYLIVISDPSTIIKVVGQNKTIDPFVIHLDQIVNKIEQFHSYYKKPLLTQLQMKRMAELLVESHTPTQKSILEEYKIEQDEVIKGVQCMKCNSFSMIREKYQWKCTQCQYTSKKAHEQSIKDYFLLIESHITNKKCREFLMLSSSKTTHTILKSMKLIASGEKKGRVYQIDYKKIDFRRQK
ncbi:hypothetical protein J6TS2_36500 [Heyndrickxia sporothermodurans]|nr:hypothetical protein J6TS2_36500 [Heyndrickxia sporothermodurans]